MASTRDIKNCCLRSHGLHTLGVQEKTEALPISGARATAWWIEHLLTMQHGLTPQYHINHIWWFASATLPPGRKVEKAKRSKVQDKGEFKAKLS